MDARKMTPAALRALADKIEAEKPKLIRQGFLKDDLYCTRHYCNKCIGYIDAVQVEKLIEEYRKSFYIAAKKGTKFVSYMYDDLEVWRSIDEEFSEMSCNWAVKFLEKIGPYE